MTPPEHYDVAILSALHKPELEKILSIKRESWEELPASAEDPATYYANTFTTAKSKRSIRVIAAAPNQMGMPASAVLATKMILRFRPKLVAMVGIAAGVRGENRGFGDILAPAHTFDYGAGKVTSSNGKLEFKPDPKPLDIHNRLLSRLQKWSSNRNQLDAIYAEWQARKPSTVLNLHLGPLGSGAAVVAAYQTIDDIGLHWRKLIGVEMEAYGVHLACREAADPDPMFLCMKGICDFADSSKDDDWQDYAAFTSAQLFHRFLTEEWDNLFPR